MTNLFTQKQIESLCLNVGFSASTALIASAIAMVEAPATSQPGYCDMDMVGDQNLIDDIYFYSYGAFQIRSLRAQKGTGGYRDELMLPEPVFNCRSALIIYTGSGFGAWSTYQTGQYKAYLPQLYPPTPGTYVVVAGDSLSKIGERLKIDWRQLAMLNSIIDPYLLRIGQVLQLPYVEYKVASGDTLSKIATLWGGGLTYQQIAAYNNIADPNKITVGQIIRIPKFVV